MKTYSHLNEFINIIRRLRAPGGCPWDRKQTHKSLKPYVLEETYEVLEAIDSGDPEHLKEELGDLLLQVILHAQVASDQGAFTIEDVAKLVSEKMIRRHPHVFGNAKVKDADEVLTNWVAIKRDEKINKGKQPSVFDGIPKHLPALFENYKISRRVARMGFDWKKPEDVFEKVLEELGETRRAVKKKNKTHIEEELGDLLFTVANLCRAYNVNPELTLRQANKKFMKRFEKIERRLLRDNLDPQKISFKKWNELWERAKKSQT
ncbi:MAG TPA: nucleoside triphosphate pyrophosphohydrolase [bacterium]|nr:nucleoside triphosphate pyrophosphohydrolase [bacterium]